MKIDILKSFTSSNQSSLEEALLYFKSKRLNINPNFKSIDLELFRKNIVNNIVAPDGLNQGYESFPTQKDGTNFCGYAAICMLWIKMDPKGYAKFLFELYENEIAIYNGYEISVSTAIMERAGTMLQLSKYPNLVKPLLINPADQLLFLALADEFKGWLNFDKKYDPGDESGLWASCNLNKVAHISSVFLGKETEMAGFDFLVPLTTLNHFRYINEKLKEGEVILYINNYAMQLNIKRLAFFGTHFIVLKSFTKTKNAYLLCYWDYGVYTEKYIYRKIDLYFIIRGIITLKVK